MTDVKEIGPFVARRVESAYGKFALQFDGPRAQKRFELLYNAILTGGRSEIRAALGRDMIKILRQEARILETLDGVSQPGATPADVRQVDASKVARFDWADFKLLRERVQDVPWLPRVSRDVVDLVDWLDGMKESA